MSLCSSPSQDFSAINYLSELESEEVKDDAYKDKNLDSFSEGMPSWSGRHPRNVRVRKRVDSKLHYGTDTRANAKTMMEYEKEI